VFWAEQALAAAKSSIPNITDNKDVEQAKQKIDQLRAERQKLLNEAKQLQKQVYKYAHHKRNKRDSELYKQVRDKHDQIQQQLEKINKELQKAQKDYEAKKRERERGENQHPYDGALAALQDAILRLQQAEIYCTKEWIALEQAGDQSGNGSSSTTGDTSDSGTTQDTSNGSDSSSGTDTGGSTSS
jgi:chromosome segregation ATPase